MGLSAWQLLALLLHPAGKQRLFLGWSLSLGQQSPVLSQIPPTGLASPPLQPVLVLAIQRTRNAVRPFRQVLYEWGMLSMAFTLLLCLDLLQISLESCEFFWRIVAFLVIATQVALALSFALGWVVFIRKIPKIGSSAQARRVSKAFFFQTSAAMFLFTYEALFKFDHHHL